MLYVAYTKLALLGFNLLEDHVVHWQRDNKKQLFLGLQGLPYRSNRSRRVSGWHRRTVFLQLV